MKTIKDNVLQYCSDEIEQGNSLVTSSAGQGGAGECLVTPQMGERYISSLKKMNFNGFANPSDCPDLKDSENWESEYKIARFIESNKWSDGCQDNPYIEYVCVIL